MKNDSIIINGEKISRKEIDTFSHAWHGDPAIPEFLHSWFDHRDFIRAFTSGSTGTPKKIYLKKDYAIQSARSTLNRLDLRPGDTALLSMPAKFIAGRMMLIRAIVGELHLFSVSPNSEPEIPQHSVNLAAFTPHQFRSILHKSSEGHDLKMKNILLGGSPVPDNLLQPLVHFSGRIFETFGMTETYSHVAVRLLYPALEDYFQAVGPASFSTEEGRLIIHAPHIGIKSLPTNDIVELLSSTRFRWLARADNVINSGGIKLSPEIIEKKLAPVLQAPFFITGIPDKIYGEKVVLVLERSGNNISENLLKNKMDKILDKYEKPKSIIWVDHMIKTPTGKINRKATINHL